MNYRLERAKQVVAAVVREVRAENVTFMAGSIAYHAFVSLLPFILLMLLLISRLGGEALARQLVQSMAANLTPGTAAGGAQPARAFADLLVSAALNATSSAGLSLVGLGALVWGTLRIFRGLDQAFSDIYESESRNSFLDQIRDGVVVFAAIALAIVALSLVDRVVAIPPLGLLDGAVHALVSVVSIAAALLPMYYVFPDEDVSVREIVPGAIVAGAGWTALRLVFGLYVRTSSATEYGVVGVVILLITWLYFGGLALLVGAAVNAVLAGRSEDVADIAWGRPPGHDAAQDDAAFVAPLRDLDGTDWNHPVHLRVGETDVTLPAPDEATVRVSTVERPAILGGDRESGRVVLAWDSR
ncbi:MAG: YihY/virulence factor BrkB family protein [Haloarculaceae archaeon]